MENQSDKWIIYPETKVVCFHNPEEENGYLSNSTPYEIKLVELFKQAKSRNEESFIEII